LIENDKKFLIIGNQNVITYKEIFKLIKENKLWTGVDNGGTKWFKVPKHYDIQTETRIKTVDGQKYFSMGSVFWFTNLDNRKRHEDIILYKNYYGNESEYPTYDNYDAINVDKISEIPMDYEGMMGVPITFIDKYNPEQFEIIGQGQGNLYRELTEKGLSAKFVEDYYKSGQTGSIKEDHPVLAYYDKNKIPVIPYMRIIIRNKRL